MLTAEIVHRRGKVTHVDRNGPCAWEGVILFAICSEEHGIHCVFPVAAASLLCEMLTHPGDGHRMADERGRMLIVQRDTVTIGDQVFPVTEADRMHLVDRIRQIERY